MDIGDSEQSCSKITEVIIKCVNFAALKHRKQRRKDFARTPYINHPIGVAYILTNEAKVFDPSVIQAALLHDTVEDTDTTLKEIEEHFGEKISKIVAEVTDDENLDKAARKEMQIVHASTSSHEAKLVKLADKLYNLRDLESCTPMGWTSNRVHEYFIWSKKVINELKGTNKNLEDILDEIFVKRGV